MTIPFGLPVLPEVKTMNAGFEDGTFVRATPDLNS